MEKKVLYYFSFALILLSMSFSCKKMDRTYKEFIVPGGIKYPEKVSDPLIYVGHNRVKITWFRGTDPSVNYAKIFWNNYMDSLKVNMHPEEDTISTIIDNLPEKSYTFIVKTFDSVGHSSVPVDLTTSTYGAKYQASLLGRPIKDAIFKGNGDVIINWGEADISNGAIASEVKYIDTIGENRTVSFPVNDTTSVIRGVKSGQPLQFRTVFIPDSLSIDTFYTDYETYSNFLLDKSNWEVIDFSTEHPGAANKVTNVIDGNPDTRWHTWVGHSHYPHFVTIDMGAEHTITTFELFRMKGDNRACNTFQLLVSDDDITWTDMGTYNFNNQIDAGQRYAISAHPTARYFKFVGISGPKDYMVTGEISVYGF